MCGITGFNWSDKQLITKMTDRIAHRGPDDSGVFVESGVSLGHRRLSILDLSKKGRQPMKWKELVITFNGEIYNFKEIRKELKALGHRFTSETDTEMILHAYREWGADCLQKFNGMFALCIYNTKKKEFFLARDRLGIKPLYYYHVKKKFIFASEIKAFDVPKELNMNAVNSYFTFRYIPNDETLVKNVFRLNPGHYMVVKGNKKTITQYWETNFKTVERSIQENKKGILEQLEQSIKYRLISDVPLGVFLSGGLDSSAIVALMSKLGKKKIKTFTVMFGDSKHSEAAHAQTVAKLFNTSHTEINVDVDAVSVLPEVVKHLDEPIGDAATIPTYLMARETRKHVTVVLSGEGSDELFAGYSKYKPLYYSRFFPPTPRVFKKGLLGRANTLFQSDLAKKYEEFVAVFNREERQKLLGQSVSTKKYITTHFTTNHPLNNLLNFDTKAWLPNDLFLKNDKMTMAHALEARVPFLDHHLVEWAASIDPKQKLRFGTDKFIYRKAIESILPKEIVERKKQGFTPPLKEWLSKGLKEYAKRLIEHAPSFMNKNYMRTIMRNASKNVFTRRQFWTLVFFVEWYRQFQGETW